MGHNEKQHSARARNSANLCLLLALLTMGVTAWFVVEGIQATEPDSPARWAKVASGVLLLVLEVAAFWLAGQWHEHKGVLRALGWTVLALEITLMSVSQISIGLTAAKAASNGAGNIEELRAQAKEDRAAAESLRADAANLRASKHAWKRDEAVKKSAAAAEKSKSAAAAVEALEKRTVEKVSTPLIEFVGLGGLIGLSVALSAALSLAGIVLSHVAGSLRDRASGESKPVDVQILELLQKIHGTAEPVKEAPAPAQPPSYTRQAIAPKGVPTYRKAIFAAGVPLAAMAAPMVHAAPQVQTAAPAATVNVDTPAADTPVNVDTPKAAAPRGEIMDTGIGEHDGHRYRRALAGVKAGTVRPSIDGLHAGVRASAPTARRYLEAWAKAGEIVKNPEGAGWIPASKVTA